MNSFNPPTRFNSGGISQRERYFSSKSEKVVGVSSSPWPENGSKSKARLSLCSRLALVESDD